MRNRLIEFSIMIADYTKSIRHEYLGVHLSKQVLRSSTAVALNYAEASQAESRKDFIHKMKVALKELRETEVNLRIMSGAGLCRQGSTFELIIDECDQLLAIFSKSIYTAEKAQ